jgi:hypothetical protein
MNEMTKDYILSLLKSDILNVTFKKVDGTERLMKCTLREDHIKPVEKTTDRQKKINEDIITVWDTEKDGWRSFRYDSIIAVNK